MHRNFRAVPILLHVACNSLAFFTHAAWSLAVNLSASQFHLIFLFQSSTLMATVVSCYCSASHSAADHDQWRANGWMEPHMMSKITADCAELWFVQDLTTLVIDTLWQLSNYTVIQCWINVVAWVVYAMSPVLWTITCSGGYFFRMSMKCILQCTVLPLKLQRMLIP